MGGPSPVLTFSPRASLSSTPSTSYYTVSLGHFIAPS